MGALSRRKVDIEGALSNAENVWALGANMERSGVWLLNINIYPPLLSLFSLLKVQWADATSQLAGSCHLKHSCRAFVDIVACFVEATAERSAWLHGASDVTSA